MSPEEARRADDVRTPLAPPHTQDTELDRLWVAVDQLQAALLDLQTQLVTLRREALHP